MYDVKSTQKISAREKFSRILIPPSFINEIKPLEIKNFSYHSLPSSYDIPC